MRQRIIDLDWTFITAPTPSFLTSDNPVRFPESEGLGHPLAFLMFPISTTMTLLASTDLLVTTFTLPKAHDDRASTSASEHQIAVLNHLTITGAYEYLYSHEATPTIARNFG